MFIHHLRFLQSPNFHMDFFIETIKSPTPNKAHRFPTENKSRTNKKITQPTKPNSSSDRFPRNQPSKLTQIEEEEEEKRECTVKKLNPLY